MRKSSKASQVNHSTKTYVCYDDGIPVSEWYTTTTLRVHDNGHFDCDELKTCYWGSAGGEAHGTWQQVDEGFMFVFEDSNIYPFEAGEKYLAIEKDDALRFPTIMTMKRKDETD